MHFGLRLSVALSISTRAGYNLLLDLLLTTTCTKNFSDLRLNADFQIIHLGFYVVSELLFLTSAFFLLPSTGAFTSN